MKVLFLDIDGVLNHKLFYDNFDKIKLVHNNYPYTEFDPTSVSLLNKILSETNAKLVISSSWKIEKKLNDILKEVGVKFDIYGITPMLWGDGIHTRGDEIKQYVDENNVDKYCILDDVDDFYDFQKEYFVKCEAWESGLNEEVANKVIEILNK